MSLLSLTQPGAGVVYTPANQTIGRQAAISLIHGGPSAKPTWEAHLTGYAYETVPGKTLQAGQTKGNQEDDGQVSATGVPGQPGGPGDGLEWDWRSGGGKILRSRPRRTNRISSWPTNFIFRMPDAMLTFHAAEAHR
jgi:hypothetical protein